MSQSPIALFVYNRPTHTERTLRALKANELAGDSALHIFADGPRSSVDLPAVESVRRLIREVRGFASVSVHEQPANRGLASAIIEGVTSMCRDHGSVIILEDDLVVSPFFLRYMNDALRIYAGTAEVASICAYTPPHRAKLPETFFLKGADCWGWATWQRAWAEFDEDGARLLQHLESRGQSSAFDLDGAYGFTEMLRAQIAGKNNSWAIRWHASAFIRNKLSLYPRSSLVDNIGNDGSGTHSASGQEYKVALTTSRIRVARIPLTENAAARAAWQAFYRGMRPAGTTRRPGRLCKYLIKLLRKGCVPRRRNTHMSEPH